MVDDIVLDNCGHIRDSDLLMWDNFSLFEKVISNHENKLIIFQRWWVNWADYINAHILNGYQVAVECKNFGT